MRPVFYMMVGVPGCGKSTFVSNLATGNSSLQVVSSDSFIERYAESLGKTYDQCFKESIDQATSAVNAAFQSLSKDKISFISDQTNLSNKTRKKKLDLLDPSADYYKIAIVFTTPDFDSITWHYRLNNREGKKIPDHVLKTMLETYEMPTKDEGFDEIRLVDWNTGKYIF